MMLIEFKKKKLDKLSKICDKYKKTFMKIFK